MPYEGHWVSPFGNLRIKALWRLPEAYRSLMRPSSPHDAKASVVRPYTLSKKSRYLVYVAILFNFQLPLFKDQPSRRTGRRPEWRNGWIRYQNGVCDARGFLKKISCFSGARKRPHLRGSCAHEVRDGKHRFLSAGRAKTRKPPGPTPRRASPQAPSTLWTTPSKGRRATGDGTTGAPPADGRATADESPMRKPCQCDGVAIAIAIAASCQCCRSQLGMGTEDWQHSPPRLPSTLQKPRDL